jgi:hypothetical protein
LETARGSIVLMELFDKIATSLAVVLYVKMKVRYYIYVDNDCMA